jgi:hypothetical protein
MGSLALGEVFADFANFTVPQVDHVGLVDGLVDAIATHTGLVSDGPGLFRTLASGGTVKYGARGGVGWVSLSGSVLKELRGAGALEVVLSVVGVYAHRVSTMHATLDVPVDGSERVRRVARLARAGGVSLSRKAVPPDTVRTIMSPVLYGAAAHSTTGTVYLGHRTSSVAMRVYDKRQHVASLLLAGHPVEFGAYLPGTSDTGPLTRYELMLGRKVGLTLRDVCEPGPVFWKYMPAELLARPSGVPEWKPCGEGFDVVRPAPDYARQLEFLLDGSPDVRRLRRIASGLGVHGVAYVLNALRRKFESQPIGPLCGSEAGSAVARPDMGLVPA